MSGLTPSNWGAEIRARQVRGRSIIGRFYPFKQPRGPSEIIGFAKQAGKYLVAESLATGERFLVLPVMLEDLRELNEMEVLAWAAM